MSDFAQLNLLLAGYEWSREMRNLDTDAAWKFFEDTLFDCIKKTTPVVKHSGRNLKKKPVWMNADALIRIKKKRAAFQRYLETKEGQDYCMYARARNQAKWACKKALRDFEKKIAKEAKSNPKACYAYARSKLRTKEIITDLVDEFGTPVSGDADKAELFNNFFSGVFTREDTSNMPGLASRQFEAPTDDIVFSGEVVLKKLQCLNVNKSPGPDGLHPRVLRESADMIAEPLSIIFSKSFSESHVPQQWKDACITPLFKKGKKSQSGNYRPVSLTSVVCKLMESILRDAIFQHMSSNQLFSEYQHGFIRGRSCVTNLLSALDSWTDAIDRGFAVDAIYLDFAKAFDTVPHLRLYIKVTCIRCSRYGIQMD